MNRKPVPDSPGPGRTGKAANRHYAAEQPTSLSRSMSVHSANGQTEMTEPTWSAVLGSIQALDGQAQDEVTLLRYGPPHPNESLAERQVLYMYGGADDRLVVVMSTDVESGSEWRQLAQPERGNEPIGGLVGQQWVDYPARYWVDRQVAVDAAELFWRNGSRAAHAGWEDPKL